MLVCLCVCVCEVGFVLGKDAQQICCCFCWFCVYRVRFWAGCLCSEGVFVSRFVCDVYIDWAFLDWISLNGMVYGYMFG